MLDRYGTTDGKPEAGPFCFCREKRQEHFPGCSLWYAGTIVHHREFDSCCITRSRDRDLSPGRRQVEDRVHGIAKQEQQKSLQPWPVALDLRQRAGKIYNEPDVMVLGEWFDERQHFLYERITVSCGTMNRKRANIAADPLDRIAGPQGLAGDFLHDLDGLGHLCGVAPQQRRGTLRLSSNGGKRLIEFMGKTGSQFAQQASIGDGHHLLKHAVHLRAGRTHLMIVGLHDRPILNRPRALLSKGLPL